MVQRPHNPHDNETSFLSGTEIISSSQDLREEKDLGKEHRRIAELEAERAQLKSHLQTAQHRIHELEMSQAAVVNRINSLIGSLGSALEETK
ncbi:MAG: hypothetical protein ACKOW3_09315 [Hyphomicrobium sp.]